jgi:two-component system, NtrC family, response regulator GlrR
MTPQRGTWVTHVGGSGRRAVTTYTLTVVKGADRGKQVQVNTPSFRVGALEGLGLQLSDPSVSGLHVELAHDDDGVRVRDLGSRNGTVVDGVLVREAVLTRRCVFTLGATEVVFEPGAAAVELPSSPRSAFGPLVGASPLMRELFFRLESFAQSDATVLIRGETGTGKELVADALVQAGPRSSKALVVVDCSALAPTLIESELFGHEKGAFTGAVTTRAGAFERASGGTVFLDELGELPLELQPRLLRVLERREVQRLGGKGPIPVDVRVIAATHRPLEEEVNRGRFRADLYYRLSVLQVDVPPLRARREDLPLLATHLAGRPVDEKTLSRFAQHDWPGNVRELRNAIERWKVGADPLRAAMVSTAAEGGPSVSLEQPYLVQKELLVSSFERAYATALLAQCGDNLAEGARLAGISRMAVVKLLTRLGLLQR